MNVKGIGVDEKTRCHHYHSPKDVVAIRFYCCDEYYACIKCHQEMADHQVEVWPRGEQSAEAVLCGNCNREMSIELYKNEDRCPFCKHPFNPGCSLHFPYYFE